MTFCILERSLTPSVWFSESQNHNRNCTWEVLGCVKRLAAYFLLVVLLTLVNLSVEVASEMARTAYKHPLGQPVPQPWVPTLLPGEPVCVPQGRNPIPAGSPIKPPWALPNLIYYQLWTTFRNEIHVTIPNMKGDEEECGRGKLNDLYQVPPPPICSHGRIQPGVYPHLHCASIMWWTWWRGDKDATHCTHHVSNWSTIASEFSHKICHHKLKAIKNRLWWQR